MKDLDAKESAQPGGWGATGIFDLLPATEAPKGPVAGSSVPPVGVPAEEPLAPAPQSSAASGVGFTQLLRTLSLHEPLVTPPAATAEVLRASGPSAAPVFSSVAPSPDVAVPTQPTAGLSGATIANGPLGAPAAAPSAGGFTQMFEAVQPERVATPAPFVAQSPVALAALPAAPSSHAGTGAGGFTQLFQALESPQPAHARAASVGPARASETFAAPVAAPPETPSQAITPQAARPEAVSAPGASAGGFTALFRSLDPEASAMQPASVERQVTAPAAVAPAISVATPSTVSPPASVAAAQPPAGTYSAGGITQLLRAIDMSDVAPSKVPVSPVASAPPAPPAAPTPAPPAAPAAVTLSSSAALPAAPPPLMASGPMPNPAAPAGASSLTGMFAALSSPSAVPTPQVAAQAAVSPQGADPRFFASAPAAAPVATPSPVAAPAAPSSGAEVTGSFTQLFRTLDDAGSAPTPGAAAGEPQGSFTQFFSSASMQPARPSTQADSFPPLPSAGTAPRPEFGGGESSARFGEPKGWEEPRFSTPPSIQPSYPSPSQPSSSYAVPNYAAPTPSGASYAEPQPRMPEPAPSAGGTGTGGLTQLLRTLDGPARSPAPFSPAPVEGAFGPPAVSPRPDALFDGPAAGASGATTAFRLPQGPAAPAAPSGPGEFTQILQASALREGARQGNGPAASSGGAGPAAPAASSGFSVSSSGMPAMPSAPAMPTMPMMGGGGAGGLATPQMPTMPAVPSVPNVTFTAPSPAAPAAGGGSKLLPILLIVVIVLLIAVLLAVVLMMKH